MLNTICLGYTNYFQLLFTEFYPFFSKIAKLCLFFNFRGGVLQNFAFFSKIGVSPSILHYKLHLKLDGMKLSYDMPAKKKQPKIYLHPAA